MEKENNESQTNKTEKIYVRPVLEKIPNSNNNKIINMSESKMLEKKFGSELLKEYKIVDLTHLYYYHYNCESVFDIGWGCAVYKHVYIFFYHNQIIIKI